MKMLGWLFSFIFLLRTMRRNPLDQNLKPESARELLTRGVRSLDLDLTPEQTDQFLAYLELLRRWNKKINLTALRTPTEIISRHFLDSLLLLPHLPETGRLLDIGSGAGFPGIPLKIARPALNIDLAEAKAKKVSFLKEVVRRLGLSGINVFPVFLGKEPIFLNTANPWEVFVSRGVNLKVVLEAVEAYGGTWQKLLLMKGKDWEEDISKLAPLLKKMEIILDRAIPIKNPLSGKEWILVVFKKSDAGAGYKPAPTPR